MKRALLFPLLASSAFAADAPIPAKVTYNRDVRPILADTCFRCHGFDKNTRKADLRLDVRDAALAKIDDVFPIVPGKPAESDVWKRITTKDEDDVMPPRKEHRQLTAREREVIKKWIEQGAEYEPHWAYVPVQKPGVPAVNEDGFSRNAIDAFVLARQHELALKHAGEADRATLCRRLHLDLTGLPPTQAQVDAFVKDARADAAEQLVEKLLASEHFGERMAVWWLDLVRYADTIGYHSDTPRNVWPYREYVIKAFNADMPFDRFTIEQIAGDLLPGSTLEQKVASGYNRLTLTTEEGGAQAKQYEAKSVVDRVKSIGTTWLAQTYMCAECHDHKYDPVTARDFYSLGAFFADIKEGAIGKREEGMLIADDATLAKLKSLDDALAKMRADLAASVKASDAELPSWEADLRARIAAKPKDHGIPKDAVAALAVDKAKRNAKQAQAIADYVQHNHPALAPARKALDAAEVERKKIYDPLPKTLVSVSTAPEFRPVRILPRGDWMNDKGEVVVPATPAYLPGAPKPAEGARLSRLDLAKWLVSRGNPLTARVVVNRLWKQFYGTGLVKTLEDLGTQGEVPPHQPLLDWLASEFMESGWGVKHLVKLMVTSGTYRQSSNATKELLARDPENRELARASRWRLDAEFVRDNALSISGLIVQKIGGPSVKPYQPEGYWENLNFPVRKWEDDKSENQWRRGLYTWWQRSYLHPAMLAFDAPTREECSADRVRSNIPQQALVLLNDPEYVEAARAFAARILKEGGATPESRIAWAWREATGRAAKPGEISALRGLLDRQRAAIGRNADAGGELLKVGFAPAPEEMSRADLVSYTALARAILNLHETVTRW
ncbi:MAG: PSD1 and planctomycete cytochrome C domain-containing protein [Chthoniobacteraceae bacterium]